MREVKVGREIVNYGGEWELNAEDCYSLEAVQRPSGIHISLIVVTLNDNQVDGRCLD